MKDQSEELFESARVKIDPNLDLDCVVGQSEAVEKLRELVRQLKHPEIYATWGLGKPKAIALVGPAGTGKTHALRALANEVETPLVELKYEDFASHLYDDTIQRLSKFKEYTEALSNEFGHVLIFVDEAEVLFHSRFDTNVHSSDSKKTNFFLRWIDGDLEGSSNFTFLAASNAWEIVDPAMRRSGRFVKIEFKALSPRDILECIRVHLGLLSKKLNRVVVDFELSELDKLERDLPENITGADVKEILNRVVTKKANTLLDRLKEGLSVEDLVGEVDLITKEDLRLVLIDFKGGEKSKQRGIGF